MSMLPHNLAYFVIFYCMTDDKNKVYHFHKILHLIRHIKTSNIVVKKHF